MKREAQPFFIVSSGRSGTTFLRALLNSHPGVFIPHESDFLVRAVPLYGGARLKTSDYRRIARLFRLTSQKDGWGWSENEIVEILESASCADLGEVVSALLVKAAAGKPSAARLGLKRPNMIFHLGRIWSVFPESRIIHLVRDGRDVCLSYQSVHEKSEQPFGPRSEVSSALYWQEGLNVISKFRGDRRLLEVRYEDLLTDPERTLELICGHLDVEYSADFFRNYESRIQNNELLEQHKNDIHANVMKGIVRGNSEKHLRLMSKKSRFIFEFFAANGLKHHSYGVILPKILVALSFPVRFLSQFAAGIFNRYRYGVRERSFYGQISTESDTSPE